MSLIVAIDHEIWLRRPPTVCSINGCLKVPTKNGAMSLIVAIDHEIWLRRLAPSLYRYIGRVGVADGYDAATQMARKLAAKYGVPTFEGMHRRSYFWVRHEDERYVRRFVVRPACVDMAAEKECCLETASHPSYDANLGNAAVGSIPLNKID